MIIRREMFAATLPATGDGNDGRTMLAAVHVEPDGSCVATNGHVLIVAKDPNQWPDADFPVVPLAPFHGSPERAIEVPVDRVKQLLASKPKSRTVPIFGAIQVSSNGSPTSYTVATPDTVVSVDTENAPTFPKYQAVIPADRPDRPVVRVAVAIDVLGAIIASAKAAAGKDAMVVFDIPTDETAAPRRTDAHRGELSAALTFTVQVKAGRIPDVNVSGVAMPCRI